MNLYVDTSIIAALVLDEPGAATIGDVLRRADIVWFSDFGMGEAYSAISIAIRTRRITLATGEQLAATLTAGLTGWTRAILDNADVVEAGVIVRRFDLAVRMPDALHIVLARRHAAQLLTRDTHQMEAAGALGVEIFHVEN